MSRRFPLEILRAEPERGLPIGQLALRPLLLLASTRASDERFAGQLVHRPMKRRRR